MIFLPKKGKVWFLIRGMNFRPCCWQGWLTSLIFIALIVAVRLLAAPEHYTLYTLLLAAGLIGICAVKSGRIH